MPGGSSLLWCPPTEECRRHTCFFAGRQIRFRRIFWYSHLQKICSPGGCFVPVAAPRGDECRVMTIVGVQGDAVVPISGVEHGFQFAWGDGTGLVEWGLGVVSLPCCLGIEGLKIYGAPRCAIFSPRRSPSDGTR